MHRISRYEAPSLWLDRSDLDAATRFIAARWFGRFVCNADPTSDGPHPAEFGLLEPYLAEAIVLARGTDFEFQKWGSAMNRLCGGDRLGHRLSAFPQPSRGQLRRVCVRATTSRAPATGQAMWYFDGEFWQCSILALPTACDDVSAKRLLVAMLLAPYPEFTARFAPAGWGWPPARTTIEAVPATSDSVPGAARSKPVRGWRATASTVCSFFTGKLPR